MPRYPARLRRGLCAALLLVAVLPAPLSHTAAGMAYPAPALIRPLAPTPMWTRSWGVYVRSRPAAGSPQLTQLDIDQELRVTGAATGADGLPWLRVRLWGAVDGWVRADGLAPAPIARAPAPEGVAVAPSPTGPHGPMPVHAVGVADGQLRLRDAPDAAAALLRTVAGGTPITVTAWATDGAGLAWYRTSAPLRGWASAGHVNLGRGRGHPSLDPVAGLGMWCTPPVLDAAPPRVLVDAAVRAHVTHLYVEVAGSGPGFYGAGALAALLPLAHRAHIAVLAWVYPFLDDVPRDVAIALAAARYVSPGGDRPDGIVADVEQNMGEPYVRAYGQVLRARLGPKVLMAVSTYPPQSYWGRRYPFATVARSWDLVVPQDYWHLQDRTYGAGEVYRYVAASIAAVRARAGSPHLPVEVLGQMFDFYQDGRGSPAGPEILAALRAARDGQAGGISFFEWNHATPAEWDALAGWAGTPATAGGIERGR